MSDVTKHISRRVITLGAGATLAGAALPVAPAQAATALTPQQRFVKAAAAYLATRSGYAALAAVDLTNGRSISYDPHHRFVTASIAKVDILMTLLLRAQGARRSLTSGERALARRMITVSDNAAASALYRSVGGAAGVAAANRRFGLLETTVSGSWGLTRTTPADQVRLLRQLVSSTSPLTAANRAYVLGLMEDVVPGQFWGVPVIGVGDHTSVKNGWLPYSGDGYRWTVNSIGCLTLSGGHRALIAVLSQRSPSMSYGITTVQRLARLAGPLLRATS